jgi:hypothetical protein
LPGIYQVRVTPLDPPNSGGNSLMRGDEVAADYGQAVTSFLPTSNLAINLGTAEVRTQDFAVTPGTPLRIISLSKPSTIESVISSFRYGISITQGEGNLFVAVASPGFHSGATLTVSGDGLSLGPTAFVQDALGPGVHALRIPISVSSTATPGLRSFVVNDGGNLAYANGYLEIAASVPDYNFDGLDDRFQRQYWPLWTAAEAAPASDPDNDGFSNRFEFRTGSNPLDSSSNQLTVGPILDDHFGKRVVWPADPGATYRLYSRRSFFDSPWQTLSDPIQAIGDVVSFRIDFSQPSDFFRLELVR